MLFFTASCTVLCAGRAEPRRALTNLCPLTPLRATLNISKSREVCNHFFQIAWTVKANITILSAAKIFGRRDKLPRVRVLARLHLDQDGRGHLTG